MKVASDGEEMCDTYPKTIATAMNSALDLAKGHKKVVIAATRDAGATTLTAPMVQTIMMNRDFPLQHAITGNKVEKSC